MHNIDILYMNNPHSNYVHKTKNKINHVVGIVPKSNRKIVETGKFYTPHTDMTGHFTDITKQICIYSNCSIHLSSHHLCCVLVLN
jgi:hypothetical protein